MLVEVLQEPGGPHALLLLGLDWLLRLLCLQRLEASLFRVMRLDPLPQFVAIGHMLLFRGQQSDGLLRLVRRLVEPRGAGNNDGSLPVARLPFLVGVAVKFVIHG